MAERDRLLQEARRREALGASARCERCGERLVFALLARGRRRVCYECDAARRGKPQVEWHHPVGRHVDPDLVVGVLGNLHRALEAMKAAWPDDVRQNPTRDPLLRLAAEDLAERDYAELMLRRQRRADYLHHLQERLCDRFGPEWWEHLDMPSLDDDERETAR